jgi:hypothetical protein
VFSVVKPSEEGKYKERKNQWITPGICKSSEKLKLLSRCIKECNISYNLEATVTN